MGGRLILLTVTSGGAQNRRKKRTQKGGNGRGVFFSKPSKSSQRQGKESRDQHLESYRQAADQGNLILQRNYFISCEKNEGITTFREIIYLAWGGPRLQEERKGTS